MKSILIAERGSEEDLGTGDIAILNCLARGLTDKAIALELRVSVPTINKRVCAVLRKTNCISRTQAAIKALRLGLLDEETAA